MNEPARKTQQTAEKRTAEKKDWLDRMRQRPPHVKRWYAFVISGSITLAIFAVWSVTMLNGWNILSQPSPSSQSSQSAAAIVAGSPAAASGPNLSTAGSPLASFENGISTVVSSFQAGMHQIFLNIKGITGGVIGTATSTAPAVENTAQ